MSELNFNDFVLEENTSNKVEKKEKTEKEKNKVKYNVEWTSGPDCIISRETSKGKQYLAILVSQMQYYIKDEKSNVIKLEAKNLIKFLKDATDNEIEVNINWCKYINEIKRINFLYNEGFVELCKKNMIYSERFSNFISLTNFTMKSLDINEVISIFKKIKQIFSRELDETEIKKNFFNFFYGRINDSKEEILLDIFFKEYEVLEVFEDEEDILGEKIGWKTCTGYYGYGKKYKSRNFFLLLEEKYGKSGVYRIFEELYINSNDYYLINNRWRFKSDLENIFHNTNLELSKFIDYIVYEGNRQGYTIGDFLGDWEDDLKMQLIIYGKIKEKYPEHLSSTHKKHSQMCHHIHAAKNAMKKELQDKAILRRNEELRKDKCWSPKNEDYFITVPNSTIEILEEARNMSNCLASYVDNFATGKTDIYFLRNSKNPEESLVDIEIKDGRLRQAYASHNKRPGKEIMEFIEKWCKKFNLEFEKEYTPRCAD